MPAFSGRVHSIQQTVQAPYHMATWSVLSLRALCEVEQLPGKVVPLSASPTAVVTPTAQPL